MPGTSISIEKIDFSPAFQDQKPGTSGLRKRVRVFQQPHYTEAFLQSIFNVLPQADNTSDPSPKSLVVGGDGRFFLKEAVQKIISIAAASGKVDTLVIGQNGILSTPAASHLIRKHKAFGGILLTASHNPGGPENDFGIKFNTSNGGPAPERITDQIFQASKALTSYQMAKVEQVPLDKIQIIEISSKFKVEIIDSVADYVHLMKQIFDFESIKRMVQARHNFKILFDAMHGVTGPYARQIFVKELGLPTTSIMRDDPLPDFGGGHPDPNLTYAHDLVSKVILQKIDFGAASDGDGDRNMILGGNGTFVNPCDSIALIAVWAQKCIPYFKQGLKGVARSMPTSRALDRVANKFSWPCYEVPTGWKFFGNLMDANKLSLCGEESFGTGSDHIREKDGLWAVLAWLSLLSHAYVLNPTISVHDILMQHYKTFGRNYYSRYDFEDLDAAKANAYLNHVQSLCLNHPKDLGEGWEIKAAGDFEYQDPVDHSLSQHQGLFLHFTNDARVIFRLSGTGSQNATLRLYFEKFEEKEVHLDPSAALKDLVDIIIRFTKFVHFVGTDKPTVIT